MASRSLVLCLLLPLLAGCIGGNEEEPPNYEVREDGTRVNEEGVPVDEEGNVVSTGALAGTVRSDAGFVVKSARVSLLGTDHFGDTDADGRFRLDDVEAGEHELAVQVDNYRPHHQLVSIVAGEVLEVDVRVFIDDSLEERPHLHDLWGSDSTYTMMDDYVDVYHSADDSSFPELEAQAYGWLLVPNGWSNADFHIYVPDKEDGSPPMVLPGTKEMRITLEWDQTTLRIDEMGIRYRAPGSRDILETEMVASGDTVVIPVEPDMWDDGHRRFSRWILWGYHDNRYDEPTTWQPSATLPDETPLHVVIELEKGETMTLDDPHRDFWGDATELVVRRMGEDPNSAVAILYGSSGFTFRLPDEVLIPPGTHRVRMEVVWWNNAGGDPDIPREPYTLSWFKASMNPQTVREAKDYETADPIDGSTEEQRLVYEIDLAAGDADGYYDTRSAWKWSLRPELLEPADQSQRTLITADLEVIAYLDPARAG